VSAAYADLARSLSNEPGLLWKFWAENATDRTAGGAYLFTDEASARTYCDMHTDVNTALTATTRGPAS